MPIAAMMPSGHAGQKYWSPPEATEESNQMVVVMEPTRISGWNADGTL